MRRNAPQESTEFWPEMNPGPTASGITAHDAHIDPHAAERATATIPRTTLFGIPHAGGSAMYYTQLKHFLPDHVDFHPLEMAGRGRRSREPLATSMETIGKDLFERMAPVARTSPYAIFGHSMGGHGALTLAFKYPEQFKSVSAFAPICAPNTAPTPIIKASLIRMLCSKKCENTPTIEEIASTKCEVAVAICAGNASK